MAPKSSQSQSSKKSANITGEEIHGVLSLTYGAQLFLTFGSAPPGHLKPLGFHQPPIPDGVTEMFEFPSPQQFWKEFVQASKPVIFRGVAKKLPAFSLWTDDFLRLHYGHIHMSVEVKKKEDRTAATLLMLFSDFLRQYEEKPYYLVESLHFSFLKEIGIPKILQCGNLQKSLVDIVGWLSSGGTKSVLHIDSMDNLNCILDGSKVAFLVNHTLTKNVNIDYEDGSYSGVDVEKVDMYRYPGLQDVPWYNVTINPGDCIFIPYMWFHSVQSTKQRNLAFNIWFHHLLYFNESDCEGKELQEFLPFYMLGMPSSEKRRQYEIITNAKGHEELSLEDFMEVFLMSKVNIPETVEELFHKLDKDSSGTVSLQEMYEYPPEEFNRYFFAYIGMEYPQYPGSDSDNVELNRGVREEL
ncbi:bifunctional peptidase and arginyl-hydroxylase JMJD5-like isoform X2 [Tachypleus tridentatus]|uniref:bifunctional peptidase and arginyl-hydroxylase JMJD5-like isoform X2 n=1 Tax=Tachypleus tridentatus TaxID=6853 RepID=UPI003FD657ED